MIIVSDPVVNPDDVFAAIVSGDRVDRQTGNSVRIGYAQPTVGLQRFTLQTDKLQL